MTQLMNIFEAAWAIISVRVAVYLLGSVALAALLNTLVRIVIRRLRKDGATNYESILASELRQPIYITVIVTGAYYALHEYQWDALLLQRTDALLGTFLIIIWISTIGRVGQKVLAQISAKSDGSGLIQPRTVSAFGLALRVTVWAMGLYLVFLVWDIDLTAWLASAGVIGVAIGFAAKDSLANLLAGVSILADAPFSVGDYIRFDDGLRGKITHIGIRSTRILTEDAIEIVIPNGLIGNARVTNESGGGSKKHRFHIEVCVAYGSKVDDVKDVLESCGIDLKGVAKSPAPRAIFDRMGDSALHFRLMVWLNSSVHLENVRDALNTMVYAKLNERGIGIPFPQMELHVNPPKESD